MAESTPVNPAESGLEVRTFYVRSRNVLFAKADFGDLYVDYYLHLSEHAIKPQPEHDDMFKRALAGFVLHQASRPWNEHTAWTINFQQPLVNLFLTGDNPDGTVTGRIFDQNVKELPSSLFYADVVRGTQPKRRSAVEFAGRDPLLAVEAFYTQSEQRTARYFDLGNEELAMMTEHPDCDVDWLRGLTVADVKTLEAQETIVLMERRIYRWHCGCNQQRMYEVLAPVFRSQPEELFDGEETLEMRCPRCCARHVITREGLEAFVAQVER